MTESERISDEQVGITLDVGVSEDGSLLFNVATSWRHSACMNSSPEMSRKIAIEIIKRQLSSPMPDAFDDIKMLKDMFEHRVAKEPSDDH